MRRRFIQRIGMKEKAMSPGRRSHLGACFAAMALIAAMPGLAHASPDCVAPDAIVSGPIAASIDTMLQRAVPFGFSGQVLVARDGTVLLNQAYGFADRAEGRRLTLRTPVGIASLSKFITASAILRL